MRRSDKALNAHGPPALPSLSHPGIALNFEYLVATAEPTDVISYQPIQQADAYAYAARWTVETAIVERRWFLGFMGDIGAASVPSGSTPGTGGSSFVLGSPELWLRGLWMSRSGLSAGGGLSVVVPVPRFFGAVEREVVRFIRIVRPWDFPHFLDLTMTVRPFFDIRHVVGPVTLQMRQGLDVSLVLGDREPNENRYDLQALASVYVGVDVAKSATLGMELHEAYQITADVSSPTCLPPCDNRRIQVTLSPVLRLRLANFAPSLSVLLPLSTPLRGEVTSFFAARLNLDVVWDFRRGQRQRSRSLSASL